MPQSLAALSIECARLLNDLSSRLHDPQCASRSSLAPAVVEDQSDRFKIWAANLGAFQQLPASSSLDYRLRESPKITTQIQDILEDIQEAVNGVFAIASGEQPNRRYDPDDDEGLSDDSANEASNGGEDGDGEDRQVLSEAEELFESVKESITSLFRISIIIRKASPRDRFAKAQSAKQNPFDPGFDIAHVGHKYPKLESNDKTWLKERLGKAITQRRQFLRYARDHRDKLAKVVQEDSASMGEPPKLDPSLPLADSGARSQTGQTNITKPISTLAPTAASTLQLLDATFTQWNDDDNQSQTSYALSTGNDEKPDFRLPRLADVAKGARAFECPFCYTIQSIRRESTWRKHVFTDLRPYLCTFEQCDSKLFPDRRDWFEHELKYHRARWHCHFCKRTNFHSSAAFQEHLRQHHTQDVTNDQLDALVDASRLPIEGIPALDCPFCVEWEDTLRQSNSHISPEEQVLVTPPQFRQHVASHMQNLALFAIPRGYLEDDADAKSAASVYAAPASDFTKASNNAPSHTVMSNSSGQSYATMSDSDPKIRFPPAILGAKTIKLSRTFMYQGLDSFVELLIKILPDMKPDELVPLVTWHDMLENIKNLSPARFAHIAYVTSLGRWRSCAYWLSLERFADYQNWWKVGIQILAGKTIMGYDSIDKHLQDNQTSIFDIISQANEDFSIPEWFHHSLKAMVKQGKVSSAQSGPSPPLHHEVESIRSFLGEESKSGLHQEWIMNKLTLGSNRFLRGLIRTYDKLYAPSRLLIDLQDSFGPIPSLLAMHVTSGAINAPRRDAQFIRQCLDVEDQCTTAYYIGRVDTLAFILIEIHWSSTHLASVKDEYEKCFGQTLEDALLGSLPEDNFRTFCIGLINSDLVVRQYRIEGASSDASNVPQVPQDLGSDEDSKQVADPPKDDPQTFSSTKVSGMDSHNRIDQSVNSTDRAVHRIVEMGFTPDEARHALRMTDLGDGLRVDRAVEMLLSQGFSGQSAPDATLSFTIAAKVILIQRLWRMKKKRRVLQELALPLDKVDEMVLSKDTPLIKELENYPIFQDFPDFFMTVYPHFVIELYQPGQIILNKGTSCPWLCWVVRGKISLEDSEGNSIRELGPGSCFGDIGTLLDQLQPADIKSKEFCIVVQLRKRDLLSGLRAHPEARAVMENTARVSLDRTKWAVTYRRVE